MLNKQRKGIIFLIYALIVVSCSSLVLAADLFLYRDKKQPVENIVAEVPAADETEAIEVDEATYLPEDEGKDVEEDVKPNEKTKQEPIKPSDEEKEENIAPVSDSREYIVQAGDTLFLIGQRLKLDVNRIKELNQLTKDGLMVGQVLIVEGAGIKVADGQEPTSRGTHREDDLYWLSRIIHAEAQGEPYEGKVAVGNVILNRVKSSDFPNTVYGVVFDKQFGYTQFSPVIDGSIYNTPNADSIETAKAVLKGERPVGDALYFLNPRKATNFWIVQNRRFSMTIGEHDFYH